MTDTLDTIAMDPAVAAAFDTFPSDVRTMALHLRALILEVAAEGCTVPTETLKWGQPSYHVPSGSPLRIGQPKTGGCALYAHCATHIISTYAATFPDLDRIEGNRAVHFHSMADIVPDRLRLLIRHALTYHH